MFQPVELLSVPSFETDHSIALAVFSASSAAMLFWCAQERILLTTQAGRVVPLDNTAEGNGG